MARPFGLRTHGVIALDQRNDVLPEIGFKQFEGQLGVLGVVAVNDLVVRDDDQHRDGFLFRQQVVHDEVGAPVINPVRGQFAAAADEIQHGIGAGAIVVRRRVNVEFAFAAGHLRMIDMARHRAVRDVACVVVGGRIAMHDELTVWRHGGERRAGVVGVGDLHAVHVEMIGIHVRPQRSDRQSPEAIVAFCERHGLARFAKGGEHGAGEPHFLGVGRSQAERDGSIVANVGRVQPGTERDEVLGVLLRVEVEVDIGLLRPGEDRKEQAQ